MCCRAVVRCLDASRMQLRSTERAFVKPEAERSRSGVREWTTAQWSVVSGRLVECVTAIGPAEAICLTGFQGTQESRPVKAAEFSVTHTFLVLLLVPALRPKTL